MCMMDSPSTVNENREALQEAFHGENAASLHKAATTLLEMKSQLYLPRIQQYEGIYHEDDRARPCSDCGSLHFWHGFDLCNSCFYNNLLLYHDSNRASRGLPTGSSYATTSIAINPNDPDSHHNTRFGLAPCGPAHFPAGNATPEQDTVISTRPCTSARPSHYVQRRTSRCIILFLRA